MRVAFLTTRRAWIFPLLVLGMLMMSVNVFAAGKAAPDFSLTDTQGKTYTLSQFKGKPVVINFFTIWCQPCRAEMPDLNEIYKEYNSKGLQFLGICLNADPNQLRFFAKQMNLDYPILNGTDKVNKDYGDIMAVPTTFIIDKQGNITEKIEGARTKADFLKMIKPLL
jgi:peroxiredoxin